MDQQKPYFPPLRIRMEFPTQSPKNIKKRFFRPIHLLPSGIVRFNGQCLKTKRNLPPQMSRPQKTRHPYIITRPNICRRQDGLGGLKRNRRSKLWVRQGKLIIFSVSIRRDIAQLPGDNEREPPFFKPGTDLIQTGREQILNLKRGQNWQVGHVT
ncbi:hypothetical protein AA100600_2604 [Gluconobacter thailandicus F149-1 = NBRC 100600]|nr:hypothetical protein AA100600_2604 [Gluconobacter thailandicus F149-1 = NBRC 100600]